MSDHDDDQDRHEDHGDDQGQDRPRGEGAGRATGRNRPPAGADGAETTSGGYTAERLRRALAESAGADDEAHRPPVPDPDDLGRRIRRRARRRQAVTVAASLLVVAVVAAAAFQVGRSDDGATDTAGGPSATSEAADGESGVQVPDDEVALPVVLPGESAAPVSEGAGVDSGAGSSGPGPASDQTEDADRSVVGYGGWGTEDIRPAATVFTRTLPDGTVLDVRANRYPEGWNAGYGRTVPWWEPADWCFPSGSFYVGVRTPAAVGRGGGTRYEQVRPGSLVVSGTVVGGPEGEPRWVVVAQVSTDSSLVRATFPDGRTDELPPVDGVVVLTAAVDPGFDLDAGLDGANEQAWEELQRELTVEVLDADGAVAGRFVGPRWGSGTATAPGLETEGGDGEGYAPTFGAHREPECTAPTELPAPGLEQPADPAAAEAAVRGAWDRATTMDEDDPAEAAAVIDDPTGVLEARAELLRSGLWSMVQDATSPVDAVVFVDRSTAYLEYHVVLPEMGGVMFTDSFAEARLVDGSWKVTRDSVCSLIGLGMAGACDPL